MFHVKNGKYFIYLTYVNKLKSNYFLDVSEFLLSMQFSLFRENSCL